MNKKPTWRQKATCGVGPDLGDCNGDCIGDRDVTTGATGATEVAPKFSDTLTLSPPGGQIFPTIAEVASKFSLRLGFFSKVNIFWEGHKKWQNLQTFFEATK